MSEHTLERWHITRSIVADAIQIDTVSGECVANMWGYGIDRKLALERARLISKAPELLEVVRQFLAEANGIALPPRRTATRARAILKEIDS